MGFFPKGEKEKRISVGRVTCEGQFLLAASYLFIWRIHRVSPGQMDHGKMNGPALRFITVLDLIWETVISISIM